MKKAVLKEAIILCLTKGIIYLNFECKINEKKMSSR